MHQLDTCDRDGGQLELFEPEHGSQPQFDMAVILFDYLIQILGRPQSGCLRHLVLLLQLPYRTV